MRAAPHWTWLAVLAALSRKARLAEHDVPESGRMLFAELLHCVCVVCGLHCFDLLGFGFKCLFLVNQTELRQKSGERERGGDFKHLVPMGSSEKTRQVDTHNLGEVYKG
jgi:hypothetical protein